jgi:1-deoxy-D-xylulose-5-phosphate reductoisomerase
MIAAPRRLTILGATGSVGSNTLDVVARMPDRFVVEALVGGNDVTKLAAAARVHRPAFVALADASKHAALREALAGSGVDCGAGAQAVLEAASRPSDIVMSAIVGAAGLEPTLRAIERGATIALANKECLVSAGAIMMRAVERHGACLIPVDSEHSAIFQVLDATRRETVEKLILTASGGPFRGRTREALRSVTPGQAIAHPNWSMGPKISVDSATMMNKGLEIIEASHLFAMPGEMIDVIVHPQSIVHSLVAYRDGSVLAQLGTPDMRTPIAVALAWPDRLPLNVPRLNLMQIANLTFEDIDLSVFSSINLARECLRIGGVAPTVLNAANEVAVAAFLGGRLGFLAIADLVRRVVEAFPPSNPVDLDDVKAADAAARRYTGAALADVAASGQM